MKLRVIPPPLLFLGCLLAGVLVHRRMPLSLHIPSMIAIVVASVLLGIAAVAGVLALCEMRRRVRTGRARH